MYVCVCVYFIFIKISSTLVLSHLDECGRDGEVSLWSKINRVCSSFCRKEKKIAGLTVSCRTQDPDYFP